MGKKILRKAEELTDEKIDTMTKFNAEICKLKHVFIDKEFKIMKENADQRHRELIETIQELKETIKAEGKDTHENLKNKIVLTEKNISNKIDKLREFDDALKGNGDPGIWESIRSLTWKFRIIMALLFIIILLMMGGNYRGVTLDKIKGSVSSDTQNSSTIDLSKKESEKSSFVEDKSND